MYTRQIIFFFKTLSVCSEYGPIGFMVLYATFNNISVILWRSFQNNNRLQPSKEMDINNCQPEKHCFLSLKKAIIVYNKLKLQYKNINKH
jgi:hypothetical protein